MPIGHKPKHPEIVKILAKEIFDAGFEDLNLVQQRKLRASSEKVYDLMYYVIYREIQSLDDKIKNWIREHIIEGKRCPRCNSPVFYDAVGTRAEGVVFAGPRCVNPVCSWDDIS
ncbi:MAG: hypothetical protein ACFFD4_02500 [Candidatus Odinarchaeota archaeon]